MPKETIYKEHSEDGSPIREGLQLHLGWAKDKYVELATCNGPAVPDETDGWYVTLDRHECNRLIRLLRKARDQAFGRDE